MSISKRIWIKRELKASLKNIDWCASHLLAVVKALDGTHQELEERLVDILEVLAETQDLIEAFERGI